MSAFRIRMARPEDAEVLVGLIRELAEYEKLQHVAQPDPKALRAHLDPAACPRCEALLAEEIESGEPIGFALFFANYSTFLTRWGLYLEDIYVRPAYRGRGVGMALFQRVAEIAVARGAQRLDWQVLDWNATARQFYEKLGAQALKEWIPMRLSGTALLQLGSNAAAG
ncbi:GNAT family N-acetyltransferase [Rhodothermus bifroesti]|uniref:GNAT family N-acetyltransferase n=1 Tax=Rhodothermus marinus TaxID=29549 RepID=A0A7V2B1V5_RHOMR|nr:GNAT family N-acetyltransferase [Rhodothermus bifroesti]GBD00382.1 Acetyltransferase YpeA [bacterium HR18]